MRKSRLVASALVSAGFAGGLLVFACGPGAIGDLTAGRKDAGKLVDAEPCAHATAPERPLDASDGPQVPTLVFAADNMRFDSAQGIDAGLEPPLGLDLDNTCNCREKPSCNLPGSDGLDSGAVQCDENGRDNVTGRLLESLSLVLPQFTPDSISKRIRDGAFSVLFEIQRWNGTDNDPNITVAVRTAVGIHGPPDGGLRPKPELDGNDVWDVEPGGIVGGDSLVGQDCAASLCIPVAIDPNAYVRDGKVVAHFASVPLSFLNNSAGITLAYRSATLIGQITKPKDQYRFVGEVSGRIAANQLLRLSSSVSDPSTAVCTNPGAYKVFKQTLCSSLDLAASPDLDGKNAPCDSMSGAASFSAVPAKIGFIRRASQQSSCPDHVEDSCTN